MLQPLCHAFEFKSCPEMVNNSAEKKDYKTKVHQKKEEKNLPYENPFPFNYKRIPEAVKLFNFYLLQHLPFYFPFNVHVLFMFVVVLERDREIEK